VAHVRDQRGGADPERTARLIRELFAGWGDRLSGAAAAHERRPILSHAPPLLAPYYTSYAALLEGLELDPKLRQLAILRVANRAAAPYIWTQHIALGRIAGVTDEQIAAVSRPEIHDGCFTEVEQLVLTFADEVIQRPRVSDSLFHRIHGPLSSREIVELLLVVGWYWTACRLTTALDVEPEGALGAHVAAMLKEGQSNTPTASAEYVTERPRTYLRTGSNSVD